MTTDKTPATLATAKHGGCVQLKDGQHVLVLREMRAQFTDAGSPARTAALDAAIAALSAQPSPGGQGDAPEIEQLRALVSSILSTVSLGHQKGPYAYAGEDFGRYLAEAARDCRTILRGLSDIAARQPVGEPFGYCADFDPGAHEFSHKFYYLAAGETVPAGCTAFYAAPPAQAVDLPYSLDADPAGIRARVADVITGTLMVGAQGHTPPPAGHWAEPFWQAARADAVAQAVDLGQLWRLSDAWLAKEQDRATDKIYGRALWACAKELRDVLALIDGKAVHS